ncbi:hypothetical protein IKP94_05170 [Candidatus Saccharibacteria bacterium]|nr:hypothetical protein [Candidatus Saccharibacteria bacterium]
MDTNTKYRRWGWGAVIGLIAVILIAGLVVALTMNKKPKTDAEVASSEGESGVVVVDDGDENTHDSSANNSGSQSGENASENGANSSSENGSANNGSANNGSSSSNSGSSNTNSEEKNTHDSSANGSTSGNTNGGEANKSEMPKTGPVDTTIAVLGMAATAYLLGLNVELAKEKARK